MFQLNLSLSWKPLYRLADPLKALGLSQSFLLLSTMQNPSPTFRRITPLYGSSRITTQEGVLGQIHSLASYLEAVRRGGGALLFSIFFA